MKRVVAVLIAVVGVVVFGVTLSRAAFFSPQDTEDTSVSVPVQHSAPVSGDAPARLRIPSLGVDAAVQRVGIAKSGHMAVPTNYTDVAWYRYGPAPGSVGSAVMDGHVDNGFGLAGVFKRLNELKPGDIIEVVGESGTQYTFVVREATTYPYTDVPAEKIFNQADQPRLNLITCDGTWVAGERTYDKRLVVYAALAS